MVQFLDVPNRLRNTPDKFYQQNYFSSDFAKWGLVCNGDLRESWAYSFRFKNGSYGAKRKYSIPIPNNNRIPIITIITLSYNTCSRFTTNVILIEYSYIRRTTKWHHVACHSWIRHKWYVAISPSQWERSLVQEFSLVQTAYSRLLK